MRRFWDFRGKPVQIALSTSVLRGRQTPIANALWASLEWFYSGAIYSELLRTLLEKKVLQKGITKSIITDVFQLNTCDHCAPTESP